MAIVLLILCSSYSARSKIGFRFQHNYFFHIADLLLCISIYFFELLVWLGTENSQHYTEFTLGCQSVSCSFINPVAYLHPVGTLLIKKMKSMLYYSLIVESM